MDRAVISQGMDGVAGTGSLPPRTINLALQGGGAHGAYTWGVLDRLLQAPHLTIEGVSGTSAGAMNAAVLVNGYTQGGREGAREALAGFWRKVSEAAFFTPFRHNPVRAWLQRNPYNLDDSPGFILFDLFGRLFSPVQLNPGRINPLRPVLESVLDIDAVNACSLIKIFVTATRVRDGRPRVFQCSDITIDALLASACLPQMFPAIEIEGEQYWDGGFVGNPAIWPLIYECRSPEVLLVQINPIERNTFPVTATEITNRVNEITFNASLVSELRAVDFVSRLIDDGVLSAGSHKRMHIHRVNRPPEMDSLNASSKLNADWDFLCYLRDLGRKAADDWLAHDAAAVGQRDGCNVKREFLGEGDTGRPVASAKASTR